MVYFKRVLCRRLYNDAPVVNAVIAKIINCVKLFLLWFSLKILIGCVLVFE